MIDSVIYAPPLAPSQTLTRSDNTPLRAQTDESIRAASAPVSQRGPQSQSDLYREVGQFVDQADGGELITGIDIHV